MATEAPSARGRSSRAAYPTLHLISKKLFGRTGVPGTRRSCACWGRGAEPPLFFSSRNKRWLDFHPVNGERGRCRGPRFARHDSLIYRDIPIGKPA